MVRLEKNKKIESAIQRAAKSHNFVLMMAEGRYTVVSGKSENDYTVTFTKGLDGHAGANCDCPAGKSSMVCHHIVSAGWRAFAAFLAAGDKCERQWLHGRA